MPETTLQPAAAAGIDTYLYEDTPTTNNGTSANLLLRRDATADGEDYSHILLKFDLSAIAPGSVIQEAKLTITCHSVTLNKSMAARFYRVLAANAAWTETGATWNTIDGATSWAGAAGCSTAGTDYDDTDPLTDQVNMTGSPYDSTGDHEFTLTPTAFQKLIDVGNDGILMRCEVAPHASATRDRQYRSSDYGTAGDRPELYVRWLEPSGRLIDYTFNIHDPLKRIYGADGSIVQLDEVRPDKWIRVEGFELPEAKEYSSLIEDPSVAYIVGVSYNEDSQTLRISTDRNQFSELLISRISGAGI